jgi:hypothetical protein
MLKKIVLIFFFIIPILTSCTQSPDFLGKNQTTMNDDLEDFTRTIKFPTYAPFEIDEAHIWVEQGGPRNLDGGKVTYREEGNPEYQEIVSQYISHESPRKAIILSQRNASHSSIEAYSTYDEKKLIEFGDGLKGLYYFNGMVQMFVWEDEGELFDLTVSVESEGNESHVNEPFSMGEIIKIAESFETY